MLKAVRRTRSYRPLVDAVYSGGPPVDAGENDKVQIEELQQGGRRGGSNDNSSNSSNQGAHGPTAPYNPNAVIPAPAAGDSVSGPDQLHQTGNKPAIIPSKQGQGHVTATGRGHGAPPPVHIVDIPPVRFPDGRNPYLDRPLPLPPPPKLSSSISTTTTTSTAPVVVAAAVPAPLRITRPVMPARPSTSAGLDSSSTGRMTTSGLLGPKTSFDRRLSKDDMALEGTTQMGMVRTNKGLQPYRIGVKGDVLPTPEPSPNAMSLSSSPRVPGSGFVPARVMTPESLSSGEIQIGMALGSPSHASFIAKWEAQQSQPQPQPQQRPMQMPMQPLQTQPSQGVYSPPLIQGSQLVPPPQPQRGRTPEPPTAPIQRQKTQKRRLFGLFGRKNAEPPKAADVIEANSSSISLASNSSSQVWQAGGSGTPARSNTVAGGKSSKFRPLISRSGTEPDMATSTSSSWQQSQQRQQAPPQLAGPGLLDIEIPDIRLERYSIMFSGVLNQQGGGGGAAAGAGGPASSLLARRQATLEKLKTINDRIQDEEDEKIRNKYRRATSPQPTNSPVFTLFPATQVRPPRPSTLAPQGSMTRMRSNTSPAFLPSPSKGAFDEDNLLPARKEKKTVTIVSPRTMDERNRAMQVEKLREQQRAPPPPVPHQPVAITGFRFGPEESALLLDSPSSMTSSSSNHDDGEPFSPLSDDGFKAGSVQPVPLKPTLAEPQWEMISTPPSTTTSSESGNSKRTILSSSPSTSTLSSVQTVQSAAGPSASSPAGAPAAVVITRKKRPSISAAEPMRLEDGNEDDGEEDPDLKAAVEISIARQISISRQQRQMLLKPVQRSNTIASNNGNRKPPGLAPVLIVNTTTTDGNGNGNVRRITRSASSPNREIAASIVASKAAVKDNGRMAETRLGVPRLVELGMSPAGNRKSERVVLEEGL